MKKLLSVFATLLASLIFAASTTSAPNYKNYPFIDETASWLAHRNVHVNCLNKYESEQDIIITLYQAYAYVNLWKDKKGVYHPKNHAIFAYGICEDLITYSNGEPYDLYELAFSIHILTHESGHLRGNSWSVPQGWHDAVQKEQQTENWALRHIKYVAIHIGITDPATLALILTHVIYQYKNMIGEDYQAPGCLNPYVDEEGNLKGCKKVY